MNEEKAAPKLRFKGFTDDWEQQRVSTLIKFHKQGFYTKESYGKDKKYYLLRGTDLSNNNISLKDAPKINATKEDFNNFRILKNDFLIVRSGNVGTYAIAANNYPAIFGSYLIDFRFDLKFMDNKFFGFFYESDYFKKQLNQITQQSANTNINAENIISTKIYLPSLSNQQMISNLLSKIETIIFLQQRKLDLLKKIKKGFLQNLFPKDGALVPNIRFNGFSGNWKLFRLADVASYRNGKAHEKSITKNGKYVVVNSKFVSTAGKVRKYSNDNNCPLQINDIAFVLSDVPNGRALAKVFLINKDNTYSLNQRIAGIRPLKNINAIFLANLLNRNNYFLRFDDHVGQTNLSKSDVLLFKTSYPNKQEQDKIGQILQEFNDQVRLQKQKIEKLKQIKKFLLQNMFI